MLVSTMDTLDSTVDMLHRKVDILDSEALDNQAPATSRGSRPLFRR